MIRPGMSNPNVGAARTNDMRRRLAEMMKQRGSAQRGPRFAGGLGRKAVAGPGVRQFGGRGPLQPSALDTLMERVGGGVVPFGRAVPGAGGPPGLPEGLPDPAVGPRGEEDFHPVGAGYGGGRLGASESAAPQIREQFGQGNQQSYAGAAQQLVGDQRGMGGLIPLGGGAYFDPSTGMLYGAGGAQGF